MKHKFVLPNDPEKRVQIWNESLEQVEIAQKEVAQEKIKVNQEIINLKLRQIQEGIELTSELSACHKRELDVRKVELALIRQRKKLEEAIASCN
jgi:hypothetical protein